MRLWARVVKGTRWAAVVVPLIDVALVASGLLELGTGVLVGLALETVLAVLLVAEVLAFRRGFRRAHEDGATAAAAVSAGLAAALPPPVAWFLRTEAGMARALCWAVLRRANIPAGTTAVPYTDRIQTMLWTTVALGSLETALVHLIVPWARLRWTLLALSAYGLLWVVALAFSLRQHPHLVGSDGLVVRFGHFRATRIPLDELISARRNVRVDHRRNIELAAGVASFSVAGETNVEAFFAPDVLVEVRGRFAQVSRVRFFADDPSAAVRLLLDRGLVSGRGNVVS